jgi:hypothetical protein
MSEGKKTDSYYVAYRFNCQGVHGSSDGFVDVPAGTKLTRSLVLQIQNSFASQQSQLLGKQTCRVIIINLVKLEEEPAPNVGYSYQPFDRRRQVIQYGRNG